MAEPKLRESLLKSLRCLAASRFMLAEVFDHPEAAKAEKEMTHFLHHREYGLAIECAEDLGLIEDAPVEFWLELKLAAEAMGLGEAAARYAERSNPTFQRTAARPLN